MVATLIGLRWRSTRNLMRREPWRVVVLVASLVWVIAMIPGTTWAVVALANTQPDNRAVALTVLAAVFAIGWAAIPVVLAASDDVLDPRRFSSFGVNAPGIMPGLVASSLLTMPALFFLALWLALSATWFAEGFAAGVIGIIGGVVQVASFVAIAKVSSGWAARAFATRKARVLAFSGAVVVVMGVSYLAWRALRGGLDAFFGEVTDALIAAIASTPIASAVSAPVYLGEGEPLRVAWHLGGAMAWTVVLVLAWRADVSMSLVTPAYRSPGGLASRDIISSAGARMPLLSRSDRLGPAGAVFGRVARAWRSDPRYLSGVVTVVVLPAIFVALIIPALGLDPRWAFAAPLVLAASVGWGRHNDIALDSTALWMDIVAGRRGGDVVRGRFAAVVAWALPLVLVVSLAVVGWTGRWDLAPALLGASIGSLGVTLAVAALTSVLLPYRTPAPGENPFGAEAGSMGAGFAGQLASSAATLVLLPFVILPCVLAIVLDPWWGLVSAVAGTALGVAGYQYGMFVAGRLYDEKSGRLLAAVR